MSKIKVNTNLSFTIEYEDNISKEAIMTAIYDALKKPEESWSMKDDLGWSAVQQVKDRLKDKGIDSKEITAHEFLKLFATNKLHNVEGLTRMRRKVQEENEHLRGRCYNERQTTQQKKMKARLGYEVN